MAKNWYTHVFKGEESNGDIFKSVRKQGSQIQQQGCQIFKLAWFLQFYPH